MAEDGDRRAHGAVGRPAGRRPRGRPAGAPGVRGAARAVPRRPARGAAPGAARRAAPAACGAVRPPGAGAARRLGRPDDRHHGHRLGQVAVLQPAHARRAAARRHRPRAVPVPDEGAGPGPGARAAGARAGQAACARRSTTATRRASERTRDPPARQHRAHQPRHAPRRDPAQPPAPGRTSSPTSRSSSSTRRTSTAACSARTWRTCCAGCGASPPRTAPDPRILLASATVANPRRAGRAADRAWRTSRWSTATGRPGAARQIAMWNPPMVDEATGQRAPARSARRPSLLADLVPAGARDDLLHQVAQGGRAGVAAGDAAWSPRGPALADAVAPYRAGYTPQQRRELEARLMRGELPRVVTTDALELGIDIGSLDACVVVTFPGTVASLRQMWGRAGRRAARPGRLRRRRGRAGPVLLPPPRRVPRRGRSRRRSSTTRTRRSTCRTCCAPPTRARCRRRGRRVLGPALARRTRRRSSPAAAGAAPRDASCCASRRTTRPRACRCARPRRTPSPSSTSPRASCWARVEAARAFSTVHEGAVYLHLGALLRGAASSTSTAAARSCEPFDGDWYTQPKRETLT